MPRNTVLLIGVLALITGILIFLALTTQNILNRPGTSTQTVVPSKKPVEKTAKIFFNPQNIDVSSSSSPTTSVDIMVDTGNSEIAGVQTELQYDPKILANVAIKESVDSSSFFGPGATVLFNETKSETGRISYAVAISPGEPAKKGVGKIATLIFQKISTAAGSTQISFLDKSLVTMLGENESVLKDFTPLTIVFSAGGQTITNPPQTNACPTPPTCTGGQRMVFGDPQPGSTNTCPRYRCL